MARLRRHYLTVLLIFPLCLPLLTDAIFADENSNANLTCHYQNITDSSPNIWILPNNEIVTSTQSSSDSRVSVVNDVLEIDDVQLSDDGTYTCFLKGDRVFTTTVRLEVVPVVEKGDAWRRYENQFITGFIAAGVALGIIVVGCLIYTFRWRDPKRRDKGDRDALAPPADFDGVIADERF